MLRARYIGLAITLTMLSLVAACGGGGNSGANEGGSGGGSSGSFVTAGVDAPVYAAMLTDETTRLVYVTNAQMLQATFRGENTSAAEPFSLTNEQGDSIEVTPEGEGYTGTITFASGEILQISLEPVTHKNAGIYRGRETIRGEEWVIGLIFLNDGKVVGSARSEVTGVVERRTSLDLGSKWSDPTTDP
jgi:hypothetical protein